VAEETERAIVAHAPYLVEGAVVHVPARVLAFEWFAEFPLVTVCVKTSASFAAALAEGPAEHAPALWCEPAPWDPRCDLVPGRGACDVHVVGAAEVPPRPSGYGQGLRSAEVKVADKLTLAFQVDARRPGRVPLGPETVLDAGGVPGIELGPIPVPDRGLVLDRQMSFAVFQAAPEGRRVAVEDVIDHLVLSGLLPYDDAIVVDLPALAPRVLIDPASEHEDAEELALVLDSITVDLDRRAVDMTWRGVIQLRLREIDPHHPGLRSRPAGLPRGALVPRAEGAAAREVLLGVGPRGRARGARAPAARRGTAGDGRARSLELPRRADPPGRHGDLRPASPPSCSRREARGRSPSPSTALDEKSFAIEERAWADVFARVPDGDESLLSEFGRLVAEFQDELAHPEELERTPKDYAVLLAHMEKRDPAKVLAEAKMTQPVFMRLERRMAALADADPNVRAEIERELELALAQVPDDEGLPPEVEEAMR
jgi:hypothetical protein